MEPQSFKVATTLAAYRIVAISAANTVAYPSSGLVLPVGVTSDTVLDTTNSIPVLGPGNIAKLYMNDTIAAAAILASDTSGRGVPFSLANTTSSLTLASAYAGVMVSPAVADGGTGTVGLIYVLPGFDRSAG